MNKGNGEPNTPSPNPLVILTKDEKRFDLQDVILKSSRVLSQMMDHATFDSNESCHQENVIPIPVEADIFKLIVQWYEHHKEDTHFPSGNTIHQTTLPFWDKQFFEALPKEKLYALMRAVNYLDLKYLREYISPFIVGTVGNSR